MAAVLIDPNGASEPTSQLPPGGCCDDHLNPPLAAPIAVMHESAAMDGPPIVQRLLQRVEDEARLRRATGTPSDDAAGECIDDKRHINKALPRGHIGEVRDPQHVWPWSPELTLDVIQRTRRCLR
jgi:hypothetical protein